jgi:hypothetical protein
LFRKKVLGIVGCKLEINHILDKQREEDTDEPVTEKFVHEQTVGGKNIKANAYYIISPGQ